MTPHLHLTSTLLHLGRHLGYDPAIDCAVAAAQALFAACDGVSWRQWRTPRNRGLSLDLHRELALRIWQHSGGFNWSISGRRGRGGNIFGPFVSEAEAQEGFLAWLRPQRHALQRFIDLFTLPTAPTPGQRWRVRIERCEALWARYSALDEAFDEVDAGDCYSDRWYALRNEKDQVLLAHGHTLRGAADAATEEDAASDRHRNERHQEGPPRPDCDRCLGLFRGKSRRPSPAPSPVVEVSHG